MYILLVEKILRYLILFALLPLLIRRVAIFSRYPWVSYWLWQLWVFSFVIHWVIIGGLYFVYDTEPTAYFILQTAANTQSTEIGGFLRQNLPTLIMFMAVFVLLMVLAWFFGGRFFWRYLIHSSNRVQRTPSKAWQIMLAMAIFVCVVGVLMRPFRAYHPWVYWVNWFDNVQITREVNINYASYGKQMDQRIAVLHPQLKYQQNTVMLVLEESINRNNMSLYGYARSTTPQLDKLREQLTVFKEPYSMRASTLGALMQLLTSLETPCTTPHWNTDIHLIKLAHAVGYKIYWVTNQDDIEIRSRFANFADHVIQVGHTNGRSANQLDEAVLPAVKTAIADPTPLKLIVVHLMGAHPYYANRSTGKEQIFDNDSVMQEMEKQEIWPMIRKDRNAYDAAIRYQDHILTALLNMLKNATLGQRASWWMVSDHGQEVGHHRNYAGHDPTVESGYAVPLVVWQSSPSTISKQELESRDVRADLLDWSFMGALGITLSAPYSAWMRQHDVFSANYQPPKQVMPWLEEEDTSMCQ